MLCKALSGIVGNFYEYLEKNYESTTTKAFFSWKTLLLSADLKMTCFYRKRMWRIMKCSFGITSYKVMQKT